MQFILINFVCWQVTTKACHFNMVRKPYLLTLPPKKLTSAERQCGFPLTTHHTAFSLRSDQRFIAFHFLFQTVQFNSTTLHPSQILTKQKLCLRSICCTGWKSIICRSTFKVRIFSESRMIDNCFEKAAGPFNKDLADFCKFEIIVLPHHMEVTLDNVINYPIQP